MEEKEIIEEVNEKCAAFEKMSYSRLMATIMSLIYNSMSNDLEILSKKRLAYAYALSRSYIEFGCFDFELISKWVSENLIKVNL